jgi:hypothetical protein
MSRNRNMKSAVIAHEMVVTAPHMGQSESMSHQDLAELLSCYSREFPTQAATSILILASGSNSLGTGFFAFLRPSM